MPRTYKVLGQAAPPAASETPLYAPAAGASAVCSGLFVCNRGAVPATFRVSVSVGGGLTAPKDFIYFGEALPKTSTLLSVAGVTPGSLDAIRVWASTADVSFNLFGQEVTP